MSLHLDDLSTELGEQLGAQRAGNYIVMSIIRTPASGPSCMRCVLSSGQQQADAIGDLELVGIHVGCETSYCGACTVIVDGNAVKSCTMFAVQADGSEVTTVEGLDRDGELHAVQRAFGSSVVALTKDANLIGSHRGAFERSTLRVFVFDSI